jgi:hypothetical protein
MLAHFNLLCGQRPRRSLKINVAQHLYVHDHLLRSTNLQLTVYPDSDGYKLFLKKLKDCSNNVYHLANILLEHKLQKSIKFQLNSARFEDLESYLLVYSIVAYYRLDRD